MGPTRASGYSEGIPLTLESMDPRARLLGPARVLALCGGRYDEDRFIRAYRWQLDLRQALLGPLEVTEVILRNALDRALALWWASLGQPGFWTDGGEAFENSVFGKLIHLEEWRRHARKNLDTDDVTHDDIIATAMLGSWRNLIGNPVRQPLDPAGLRRDGQCATAWGLAIKCAFPLIPETRDLRDGQSPRGYVGIRLARIGRMRNRVCHCEDLAKVNVEGRMRDIGELLHTIDDRAPALLWRLCGDCALAIAAARPSWLASDEAMGECHA